MANYMLILIVITFARSKGVTGNIVTCNAPAVYRGRPANITFHFHDGIWQGRTSLRIEKYPTGDGNPQAVLRCRLTEGTSHDPVCSSAEGYTYYIVTSRNLTLHISSATEKHVGTYTARVPNNGYCKFKLNGRTTCHAPSADKGYPANITCDFHTDIGLNKTPFGVDKYSLTGNKHTSLEAVLRCYWSDNVPNCTIKDNYSYSLVRTHRLILTIINATEDFEGSYACQELPSHDTNFDFCNFTLNDEGSTTCEASAVEKGNRATITCNFPTHVMLSRKPFGVDKYNLTGSSLPKVVLRCYWPENNTDDPRCDQINGYSYELAIAHRLILTIMNATEEFEGSYACQELPSHDTNFDFCDFTLNANDKGRRDRSTTALSLTDAPTTMVTTTESESGSDLTDGAIAGIVLAVVFIVIVIVIVCWRRGKADADPVPQEDNEGGN